MIILNFEHTKFIQFTKRLSELNDSESFDLVTILSATREHIQLAHPNDRAPSQ